jgi:hypothetical protein
MEFSPLIFLSTYSADAVRSCRDLLNSAGYSVALTAGDVIWAEKRL